MVLATQLSVGTRKLGFPDKQRVLRTVSVVVLGTFIYNFPWFFAFVIEESKSNATMNCLATTKFRESKDFVLWYANAANLVFTGAVPFIGLVIFNWRIVIMIRQLSKEREILDINGAIATRNEEQRKPQKLQERRRAIILFVIVIAFILLHSLRAILNIEEMSTFEERKKIMEMAKKNEQMCRGYQIWTEIAQDYSQLLLMLNASINFFIYGLFGKQFREAIKEKMLYVGKFFCRCKNDGKYIQNGITMTVMKP